jgi:uncharacterized protein (TIGR03067 family)
MMRLATLAIGTAALTLLVGGAGGGEAKKQPKLQGSWKVVAMVQDGNENNEFEDHIATFDGKTFAIKKGDEVVMKGTYKADLKKKPHQIDFTFEEGPGDIKDKNSAAIYEIKGDTLRICSSRPGDDNRPTEFSAADGSRRILVTLKREKK